jgi:hypothetical protein
MKAFQSVSFDVQKCRTELSEFGELLKKKPTLSEQKDILPFFKTREHLSAFIGNLNTYNSNYDSVAHELSIFGDFTSDLAVGDKTHHAYCLVEFEDASESSIFQQTPRHHPDWSKRFEHGFSQLIDWMWKMEDQKPTKAFRDLFGSSTINAIPMLVIGRSSFLSSSEKERFAWRRNSVSILGSPVICFTYDELFDTLQKKASFIPAIAGTSSQSVLVSSPKNS